MTRLHDALARLVPRWRDDVKALLRDHGTRVLGEATLEQAFAGLRGVRGLLCETSLVEPDTGLLVRGVPIRQLADRLPEEVFWLLATGSLPDAADLADFRADLAKRRTVPAYVWDVLRAMPPDAHPMTMFSAAILVMQGESKFHRRYHEGLRKEDYWIPTLEDALDLLARVPAIAAGIHAIRFRRTDPIPPRADLDLGADLARMLGLPDGSDAAAQLMRLYLVLHCDHEGGNVSAFTALTVNSALSCLYYALSAGLDGLAGPLHGLANQECLAWILDLVKRHEGVPTREETTRHVRETLAAGRVVPGYGHAVLRITDPRFDAFMEFGRAHCPDDPIFRTVAGVFDTVPEILRETHKIKDPWPNVDAISGSLLHHYGLRDPSFYTVLFGVSRAMGISAQGIVNRALGMPIVRPKSVTTEWVRRWAAGK